MIEMMGNDRQNVQIAGNAVIEMKRSDYDGTIALCIYRNLVLETLEQF